MTNAEKFQKVFGYYATEMWAKPEKEFLEWINAEAVEQEPSCRNTRQADLISRADLQELFNETTTSLMDKIEQKDIEHLVRACVMVTEMIQDAPSVVPKRGKWEKVPYLKEWRKCSECDSRYTFPWHYCPNCGADMRGDEQ